MPISISYKVSESVKPEKDQQQFYPFPQSNSKYRIELNKIKTKGGKIFVLVVLFCKEKSSICLDIFQ